MYEFTAYFSMSDGGSELPVVATADSIVDAALVFEAWRARKASDTAHPMADELISREPVRITRDTGNDLVRPGVAMTRSNWFEVSAL